MPRACVRQATDTAMEHSHEIVEHLRTLRASVALVSFEVGMTTRSRASLFRRRVQIGAHLLTTGPAMDPDTVDRVEGAPERERRRFAWSIATGVAGRARSAGFAGIVLKDLRFETATGETYDAWQDERVEASTRI